MRFRLGLLWHHPLAVDDRNDSALLNGLAQLLSAGQLRQFLAGLEVGAVAPFWLVSLAHGLCSIRAL